MKTKEAVVTDYKPYSELSKKAQELPSKDGISNVEIFGDWV